MNPTIETNAAIESGRNGDLSTGLEILSRVVSQFPDFPFAHYEASLLFLRLNNIKRSWLSSYRAFQLAPNNYVLARHHCLMLSIGGFKKESIATFLRIASVCRKELINLKADYEFIEFLNENPFARHEIMLYVLRERDQLLSGEAALELMRSKFAESAPFAFVRLGDGEGAWLPAAFESESRFSNLRSINKRNFLFDWFGDDGLYRDADFGALSLKLFARLGETDLLGIPEENRICSEFSLLSARGYPSCSNIIEIAHSLLPNTKLISAGFHQDLIGTNFYPDILNSGRCLYLITSQTSLSERLAAHGIKISKVLITPGDSRNFTFSSMGKPEVQFPDVFGKTLEQLRSLDLANSVVLVAAGYVGKHYIYLAKERGAFAFDLGSVADKWSDSSVEFKL